MIKKNDNSKLTYRSKIKVLSDYTITYPAICNAIYIYFFGMDLRFSFFLGLCFSYLGARFMLKRINLKEDWQYLLAHNRFKNILRKIGQFLMSVLFFGIFYFINFIATNTSCGSFCFNSQYIENLFSTLGIFASMFSLLFTILGINTDERNDLVYC